LKINNSLNVARWEKLICQCNHDSIEKEYPIFKCQHCRCKEAWESVPQKDFTIQEYDLDGEGEPLDTTHDIVISEITLVRGHDLEDVIGWHYNGGVN